MGVRGVRRVPRYGEHVEPEQGPLVGNHIADVHPVLRLLRAVARLDEIPVIAERDADITVGYGLDIDRGVDGAHVGTNLTQHRFDVGKILRRECVGIPAQVFEHQAHHAGRRVEEVDAALRQSGGIRGVEDQAPTIQRCVRQRVGHHFRVVADAVGSPRIHDTVRVTGVIERDPGHDGGVEIDEVGKLCLVEGQIGAAANLPLKEGSRRKDDIESAVSRQHPSFQRLIGIEIRDADLDTRHLFERCNGVGRQIVGPNVEIENLLVAALFPRLGISRVRIRPAAADQECRCAEHGHYQQLTPKHRSSSM